MPSAYELGKISYEAYLADSGGLSAVTGDPLPSWEGQDPGIRMHWEAAAEAVARAVTSPPFHYGPASAAGGST